MTRRCLAARYRKLTAVGKPEPKVVVAIARELVGRDPAAQEVARRWHAPS
jgi:hypothetical protein